MNRDTALKSGQIAHLDRDPGNASFENLAFLCFEHHDEYDSRTSQRKGLTLGEVTKFRAELIAALARTFSQDVHFGQLKTPPSDPYAGQWVRIGTGSDSAEILLTPLPDTAESIARYFIYGTALWGTSRRYGPNLGFLEFVGTVDEPDLISYRRSSGLEIVVTDLQFVEHDLMRVTEQNWVGEYGMNVTFEGVYRRA